MKPISTRRSAKSRDDLIYTFADDNYRLFKVLEELPDDRFKCREFNISPKSFKRHPTLDFGNVGVFNNHGYRSHRTVVSINDVKGKVFSTGSLVMTIGRNLLTER